MRSVPEYEKSVIRLFGVRRSGNHAVADFLIQNAGPKTIFLNRCKIRTGLHKKPDAYVYDGEHVELNTRVIRMGSEPQSPEEREAHRLFSERLEEAETVVMFFEEQLSQSHVDKNFKFGPSHDGAKNVIVTRQFPSWISSVYMHKEAYHGDAPTTLEGLARICYMTSFWIGYANIAMGLSASQPDAGVFFDDFLVDEEVRANLLKAVGLEVNDLSLPSKVSPFGKGSSFVKDLDVPPSAADLRTRWKGLETDPLFRHVVNTVLGSPDLRTFLKTHFQDDLAIMETILGSEFNPLEEAS